MATGRRHDVARNENTTLRTVAQESKMRENHISAASLSVGWLKATPRRLSRISQSRETQHPLVELVSRLLWFCGSSVQMAILTVVELVPQTS
jgi:hypothetical protein